MRVDDTSDPVARMRIAGVIIAEMTAKKGEAEVVTVTVGWSIILLP
jgi:hypothetical protein